MEREIYLVALGIGQRKDDWETSSWDGGQKMAGEERVSKNECVCGGLPSVGHTDSGMFTQNYLCYSPATPDTFVRLALPTGLKTASRYWSGSSPCRCIHFHLSPPSFTGSSPRQFRGAFNGLMENILQCYYLASEAAWTREILLQPELGQNITPTLKARCTESLPCEKPG